MNTTYDIEAAFERIEDLLISNMKANLTRHLNEEQLNQLTWAQWQSLQTDALKQFRKANPKLFKKEFEDINKKVEEMLRNTYNDAATKTENELLKHYVGQQAALSAAEQMERHRIHEDKLNALIEETTGNFKNAESAILRKADDAYRKIIFDSQVYLNSGSGTLTQAIDMATKDFLSQGLNCIEYKNGNLVNISSYSEMALRTANTRATLQGEASKRDEWGEPLVMITYRSSACPKCVRFIGKIFVDDVWGISKPKRGNKYPQLSSAIAAGLYHPNCKDSHTTYFEGITKQRTMTPEEEAEAVRRYNLQQEQRYNERQIRKYKRLENGSISEENKTKYAKKRKEWQSRNNEFVKANDDVLRRDYSRERVRVQDISKPAESALATSKSTPKFTPAKTMADANVYANKFADNPAFNTSSKNATELSSINTMNEVLTNLDSKYPLKQKLWNIDATKSLGKGVAAQAHGLGLDVSTKFLKNPGDNLHKSLENRAKYPEVIAELKTYLGNDEYNQRKLKKTIASYEESAKYKRWTFTDMAETAEEAIRYNITHEYGHIVADQYSGQITGKYASSPFNYDKSLNNIIDAAFDKAKRTGDIYNISEYASTNNMEFFAESFVAYDFGYDLPDYIVNMIESVLNIKK